ncbi:unnamed protein product [Discula destructiva]
MDPAFPPTLSYVSFVIGISSFALIILNLLALYANFMATIRRAPEEIRDTLGNLREQLLEEREALRQQTRELRNKKAQIRDLRRSLHPAHAGRPRSSSRGGVTSSYSNGNLRGTYTTLTHSEQTLSLHYQTIRDLWRQFKSYERPFLVSSGANKAGAIHKGGTWIEDDLLNEKGLHEDMELHGEAGSTANYSALYQCDFVHRFIWFQSKASVLKLADTVQGVMLRRMEREVTNCRMMLRQIRDGGDGPEDINSPQFDGGGGGGGGGPGRGSRGNTPMGLRKRPVGESQQVYSSSESSDESARLKGRPDERDGRVNVTEVGTRSSPTRRGPPRGEGYETRYAGEGWRQAQYARGHPPVILELPRPSRPRTRSGHDGPPSPYDLRR